MLGVWIGHQDWLLELANDYLSLDDRVSSEGKQDFGQLWVDGHWIGKTLTVRVVMHDLLDTSEGAQDSLRVASRDGVSIGGCLL